jgi:hypothetical protein
VKKIVTIKEMLEPEDWDLDYETNFKVLLNWLHSNWEMVKNDLQPVLDLQRTTRTTRTNKPDRKALLH